MRSSSFLLFLVLVPGLAWGQRLGTVDVRGVEGEMADNVRKLLSLNNLPEDERADPGEARLEYLLRKAPDEVARALEPYGYYETSVTPEITRRTGRIDVTLQVSPGEPVVVDTFTNKMDGPGQDDPVVVQTMTNMGPRPGEVLNHARYEAGKSALQHVLLARGYFDARMDVHRVEVSRSTHQAAIDLAWRSGSRYRFGETTFEGAHVRESLLTKSVTYSVGEPYDQDALLKLHQRLTALDYFGYIDVRPDVEHADEDEVPIVISLMPGKRSVYTAGLSFGTDSGAGIQLGLERRWLNTRGHKLKAQLDWAQRRKSVGLEYRIPAFAISEGWYTVGANRREEESDVLKTRITELAASRSGAWRGWTLNLGMHMRDEDYVLGSPQDRREGLALRGRTRLIYPALSAQRVVSDDPMYPSRGFSLRGEFKLGAESLGSDVSFGQFLFDAKVIRSFGASNRILLRGQMGRTIGAGFERLPPSLRFFAGGDRSIRGYGYQEVGPRVNGLPTGGRNLLVGSAEYERMFNPSWGAAVFVDAGNAFNEINDGAAVGAGVGLRWRSPVGMVRFDVAHGFESDASRFQIHINIGPDL